MELFYYFVGFGVLSPRSYIARLTSVLNQARLKLEILLPSPYNKSSAISTTLSSVTVNSPCYLCQIKYKWSDYLIFGASNLEISQNLQMYFLRSLTPDKLCRNGKITRDLPLNVSVEISKKTTKTLKCIMIIDTKFLIIIYPTVASANSE